MTSATGGTPSMDEIRTEFAWEYKDSWTGYWENPALLAQFDRAIAAHDAELRAEIAAEIRALIDRGYLDASTVGATKRKYLERAATLAEGKNE
jgi:hypothetical protein